jgi:hypothetical protein
MTQKLNPFSANPSAMQPWIELGKTIQTNGLDVKRHHGVTHLPLKFQ